MNERNIMRSIDGMWSGVVSQINKNNDNFMTLMTMMCCINFVSLEHMKDCLDESIRYIKRKYGYDVLYKMYNDNEKVINKACDNNYNKYVNFKIMVMKWK